MQGSIRFTSIQSRLSYVAVMPKGTEFLHFAQQAFIRIAGYDPLLGKSTSDHLLVVENTARALERASAHKEFAKLPTRRKMEAAEQLIAQSLRALNLSLALHGAALNAGTATRQLLANALDPEVPTFIESIMSVHVPYSRILPNSAMAAGEPIEIGKLN